MSGRNSAAVPTASRPSWDVRTSWPASNSRSRVGAGPPAQHLVGRDEKGVFLYVNAGLPQPTPVRRAVAVLDDVNRPVALRVALLTERQQDAVLPLLAVEECTDVPRAVQRRPGQPHGRALAYVSPPFNPRRGKLGRRTCAVIAPLQSLRHSPAPATPGWSGCPSSRWAESRPPACGTRLAELNRNLAQGGRTDGTRKPCNL